MYLYIYIYICIFIYLIILDAFKIFEKIPGRGLVLKTQYHFHKFDFNDLNFFSGRIPMDSLIIEDAWW